MKQVMTVAHALWDGCIYLGGVAACIMGVFLIEGTAFDKTIWLGIIMLAVGVTLLFVPILGKAIASGIIQKWWLAVKGENQKLIKRVSQVEKGGNP